MTEPEEHHLIYSAWLTAHSLAAQYAFCSPGNLSESRERVLVEKEIIGGIASVPRNFVISVSSRIDLIGFFQVAKLF